MPEPVDHLRGVKLDVGRRCEVGEVEKMQESFFMSAVLQHGNALAVECVVQVHDVHPVAAIVEVGFSEPGHPKEVLVAERDGRESHAACPNHVDFRDGRVREEIDDSIPRPGEEQPEANKEGQKPKQSLDFGFVRRECVLQPVDFCFEDERCCDVGDAAV